VSTIGGATLAGFDLPTAQHLFGKPGKLDEIAVAAGQGVSDQKLLAQLRTILPADTTVRTAKAQSHEDSKETDSFISFLQKFLLGFGGVALFVGSFVIANSLSITIAQRTREFATLRTLGASRGQVLRSVVLEALVMGVLASVVGLFAGLALAKGLFSLFDAVGFTLPNNGLTLETRTVIVALVVGLASPDPRQQPPAQQTPPVTTPVKPVQPITLAVLNGTTVTGLARAAAETLAAAGRQPRRPLFLRLRRAPVVVAEGTREAGAADEADLDQCREEAEHVSRLDANLVVEARPAAVTLLEPSLDA
jgi:hypothetical protein